jgi:hypothetical protein
MKNTTFGFSGLLYTCWRNFWWCVGNCNISNKRNLTNNMYVILHGWLEMGRVKVTRSSTQWVTEPVGDRLKPHAAEASRCQNITRRATTYTGGSRKSRTTRLCLRSPTWNVLQQSYNCSRGQNQYRDNLCSKQARRTIKWF